MTGAAAARPVLAQAVVTDPGGAGYRLVARSPGLTPQEADALERSPGVSDYLSTTQSPGSHYAFHPLPGGRFGFSRRFVEGTRRGSYNRVIAHTLVLGEAELRALGHQPWLLVKSSELDAGEWGRFPSFIALGARIASEQGALPDVGVGLSLPVEQACQKLVTEWRTHLRAALGQDELTRRLLWLLEQLESGKRVALGQASEAELLISLAWSALPDVDRRACAWTTHHAPSRIPFQLVLAPDPTALRRGAARPGDWALEGEAPETVPGQRAAPLLVDLIVSGRMDALAEVWARRPEGASLLDGRWSFARWLSWQAERESLLDEGAASLAELDAWLAHALAEPGRVEAWADAEVLRRGCLRTLARQVAAGDADAAFDGLAALLARHQLVSALLAPGDLAALPDGDEAVLAFGLAASATPPPADAAALLRSWPDAAPSAALAEVLDGRRAGLWLDLARRDTGAARSAADWLAASPPRAQRAAAQLRPVETDLAPALVLASAVRGSQAPLASKLAAEVVLPLLLAAPELANAIPRGDRAGLAGDLARQPGVFARALAELRGGMAEPLTEAWLAGLRASEPAALEVADLLLEGPASGAPLAPARLRGVSAALAAAAAPPETWLAFAAGEIAALEAGSRDEDALLACLDGVRLTRRQRAALAPRLLAGCLDAASATEPGAAMRGLFELTADAWNAEPARTADVIEAVARHRSEASLAWAPLVPRVLDVLRKAAPADESRARCAWLRCLPALPWSALPEDSLALLRASSGAEITGILPTWQERLGGLGETQQERDLLAAFERSVAGDPRLEAEMLLTRLQRGFQSGRRTQLASALKDVSAFAAASDQHGVQLERMVERTLEFKGALDAHSVIELILSKGGAVPPTVKQVLENDLLARLLKGADAGCWPGLPAVLRRETLAVRMAEDIGRRAVRQPDVAVPFCREAVKRERFDLVGICLSAAGKGSRVLRSLDAAGQRATADAIEQAAQDERHAGHFTGGVGRRGRSLRAWFDRGSRAPTLR